MKKLLILVTGLMFSIPQLYAQNQHMNRGMKDSTKVKRMNKPAEERAEKYTKWMDKEVQLTPDQRKAAYDVNLDIASKVDALKKNKSGDRKQMKEKREALEQERDARLKPILTTVQWDKYVAARKEKKNEMEERMKNKKDKGKGKKKGHEKHDGE